MEPEIILSIFRGLERLAIVAGGAFSLWLGYELFRRGVVDEQEAVLEARDFKISLQKVGPGAFFAVVGGIVLVAGVVNQFSWDIGGNSYMMSLDSAAANASLVYSRDTNDQKLLRDVAAINSIRAAASDLGLDNIIEQKDRLYEIADQLEYLREVLILQGVGDSYFDTWEEYRNDFRTNRESIGDTQVIEVLEEVSIWDESLL